MITQHKERKLKTIKTKQRLMALGFLFFGFTLLCVAASLFYGRDVGPKIDKQFDGNGGIIGPIEVTEPNTLYEFEAIRSVPYGSWSFVGIELINDEGEYLMGFGDEFWAEQGYDSDGQWSEAYEQYATKVVIPGTGVHFVKVNVENPSSFASSSPVYVSLQKRAGGVFLFKLFMILSLAAGIVCTAMSNSLTVR